MNFKAFGIVVLGTLLCIFSISFYRWKEPWSFCLDGTHGHNYQRIMVSHHKSGYNLSRSITRVMQLLACERFYIQFGGHWFGQGFLKDEDLQQFEKIDEYHQYPCAMCFDGIIAKKDRLVNFVRDPYNMIISGYLYHKRGSEAELMTFADLGERGGDLVQFINPKMMKRFNLPVASPQTSYPFYLQKLGLKKGLLSEMVRQRAWELPEMLFSFESIMGNEYKHSICLEEFMSTKPKFNDAIRKVFFWLDVNGVKDIDVAHLYNGGGDHSTNAVLIDKERASYKQMIAELDGKYFDGYFTNAADKLHCFS